MLHVAFDDTPYPRQRVGMRSGRQGGRGLGRSDSPGGEIVEETLAAHRDLATHSRSADRGSRGESAHTAKVRAQHLGDRDGTVGLLVLF